MVELFFISNILICMCFTYFKKTVINTYIIPLHRGIKREQPTSDKRWARQRRVAVFFYIGKDNKKNWNSKDFPKKSIKKIHMVFFNAILGHRQQEETHIMDEHHIQWTESYRMAATEYCHLSSNPWCTTSSVAINPLFEVESRMKIDTKSSKSKKTDKLIYACHMIKRFTWIE